MSTAGSRSTGRYLARLLLSAAVVAAVFAMHGASHDHMLAMPTQQGAPVAMTGQAAHHTESGTTFSVRSVDTIAMSAAAAAGCGIAHAECIASLRTPAAVAAPLSLVAVMGTVRAIELHSAAAALTAPPRAPPRPSLDRLGISRT